MHEDDTLLCVLCQRSEQTNITGALSTKNDVTAHQNCLLFASGLKSCNTPQFYDLFGFSVEDVLNEVQRGRKLICNKCKKRGATAGCEVKRCKKSYHYPCAVEERAEIIEDKIKEKYVLYCYKHYPKTQGHNELTTLESLMQMGFDRNRAEMAVAITGNQGIELAMDWYHENDPGTDELVGNVVGGAAVTQSPTDEPSIADPAEENNPSENGRLSLSSQSRAYRNPEEAGTSKNASGDSTDQRPTVYSSDSNSSSSRKPSSIKRRLSFRDKQNGTPSKRRSKVFRALLTDDSSNSGDNEPDWPVMAPLDTDIDDSEQLVHEPLTRETHFCLEKESRDGATDEDETIISDAESESLLRPFSQPLPASQADFSTQTSPMLTPSEVQCKTQTDDGGSLHMNQELELCAVSPDGSPVHSPSDPHTAGPSPSALTDAGSSACVTLPTSCSPPVAPPPHVAPPQDPSPSGASSRFWRSCNAAGCTQNIFIGFFKEMSDVSDRIQAEQASQEDYDLALTVMRASGKLLELVGNQQEELQGKQRELQEAAAAMEEAVSALKRDEEQLSQSHTHHS